jgi:hypothetical protein
MVVTCDIVVPFYSYDTQKDNLKCGRYISKYIQDTLRDKLSYMPLLDDKDGTPMCSSSVKIKIRTFLDGLFKDKDNHKQKKQSSCRKSRQRGGKTRR